MSLAERLLPPYWSGVFEKRSNGVRPYFGWLNQYANGPGNRTKRMIKEFGNSYINPNVVYAQSSWSESYLKNSLRKIIQHKVPMLFNQNGWYYPAWYKGDWKKANNQLLIAHEHSKQVIFQSHFCIEAMSELTGVIPRSPIVLHNAVHVPATLIMRKPNRPTLWLSGAFHRDADHILLPALKAMEILAQEKNEDVPLLKIAGYFDKGAKKCSWYLDVISKINALSNKNACLWVGEYSMFELPSLMQDVCLALHLTSKDSCPNAVLERMALGVGHIYANSGGTPELVGQSGIGISSPVEWGRQTPVEADELAEAIKNGLRNWKSLGDASFARAKEKFSWDHYIDAHRKLFNIALQQTN